MKRTTKTTTTIVAFKYQHLLHNHALYYSDFIYQQRRKLPLYSSSKLAALSTTSCVEETHEEIESQSNNNIDDDSRVKAQSSNENNNNNNNNKSKTSIESILLLNFVAIIWGTQHSIIKMTIADCDTSIFTFTRFLLAALIATVGLIISNVNITDSTTDVLISKSSVDTDVDDRILNGPSNDSSNAIAWRWGIEMGLWMLLGYAFQAIGLEVCQVSSVKHYLIMNQSSFQVEALSHSQVTLFLHVTSFSVYYSATIWISLILKHQTCSFICICIISAKYLIGNLVISLDSFIRYSITNI